MSTCVAPRQSVRGCPRARGAACLAVLALLVRSAVALAGMLAMAAAFAGPVTLDDAAIPPCPANGSNVLGSNATVTTSAAVGRDTFCGGGQFLNKSIFLGNDASSGASDVAVDQFTGVTVIGGDARADSAGAVTGVTAIGYQATAGNGATNSVGATALGANTTATLNAATAVGFESSATNVGAIALGGDADADGTGASASAAGAIAIGDNTLVSGADAIAIGTGAQANLAGSIALGKGSTVAAAVANPNDTIGGTLHNYAGGAPTAGDVVSIGSSTTKRQLQNVAAGQISATSTDAVNGSQLFATNQELATIGAGADNLGQGVAGALGGGASYDPTTGNLTAPSYTVFDNDGTQDVINNVGDVLTSINSNGIKYFHANSAAADSQALGAESVAIGPLSVAAGDNSIAVGNGANASAAGDGGIAIGNGANVSGVNSIAIGVDNNVSGANSGAFGDPNTITGGGSYAIGNNNTIGANNAFVLGNAVTINANNTGGDSLDGAIALGDNSSVGEGAVGQAGVTIGGTAFTFAGGAPDAGDVLTVGSAGNERQIQNVAAGRLSATSTDAVNGSQLFATNQKVNSNTGQINTNTAQIGSNTAQINVNTGDIATNTTNIANNTSQINTNTGDIATNTTQINTNTGDITTLFQNSQEVADALGTTLDPDGTIAPPSYTVFRSDGTPAQVDNVKDALASINDEGIKYFHANSNAPDSQALGAEAIAIGPKSVASGDNSISMGNGANASGNNSIAVGTNSNVSGNHSGAIGDPNTVTGNNSYAVGNDNNVAADNAFVVGNNVTVDAAQDGSVALGNNTEVAAPNPTSGATIGGTTRSFAGANPTSVVSVGSAGAERQITNVAAGRLSATSTDAVNGSQLFATNQQVNANTADIANFDDGLDVLNERMEAGVASAIAMASLPQAYAPGQSSAAVALGQFEGETGLALGLSAVSDSGRYVFKFNVTANTEDDLGAGVGAAFMW